MTTEQSDPLHVGVTGAAGYMGSRVITLLQEVHPEWKLTAIDNFYLGDVREVGETDIVHVDVRNRSALEDALAGSDIVLHLAAVSGVDDCETNADLAYEVNVTGTTNVAWFCRKTGAALIFPLSMAMLGDPESFPISVDDSRDPVNWYGRTKLIGERLVEEFAADAFPAHLFLKSNLYGEHTIDDRRVSKGMVINLFVDKVFNNEPLTVYKPGTQSRNYIHIDDASRAYIRSAERLQEQLSLNETGVERYEIASSEDPGVMTVAEIVRQSAQEETGIDVDITLVENPRSGETLVDQFGVDISKACEQLNWEPQHTVESSIRQLLHERDTK